MIPKDRVITIMGHMELAFHWNQINLRINKNNLFIFPTGGFAFNLRLFTLKKLY